MEEVWFQNGTSKACVLSSAGKIPVFAVADLLGLERKSITFAKRGIGTDTITGLSVDLWDDIKKFLGFSGTEEKPVPVDGAPTGTSTVPQPVGPLDAIADANKAIELNPFSSKAFLCKGTACFQLEEYETAKTAFTAGANLEPSNSDFQNWLRKCDDAIAAEYQLEEGLSGSRDDEHLNEHKTVVSASSPSQSKPVQKFRHTFYQNTNEAVVEILAKGLRDEQVKVEFGVQSLKVVIDCPPNEPYIFQTRLNRKVITEKCKYTILNTKVEIRLAKAESLTWSTLQYNESLVAVQIPIVAKPIVNTKLEYPSSSKKGHKDWDKLEAEVIKEEKDEKLEGDAALNKLFRDIYGNANEETRRAMNKSFVESNGTVLSTNWKDVGKKYVEGSPPSGMDMKKWEM